MYMWGRYAERVKVHYRTKGLAEPYEGCKEKGQEQLFFDCYASPSFNKYVDNLRKAEREKFEELYKGTVPMNTFIPNLGYKVKHRFSDDIVYVLDMGPWENRAKREIDTSRERLDIFVYKNEGVCSYYKNQGMMDSFLQQAAYYANERYVDRLTKKQREAITFIRMLPEGEFVEGIGAWVQGYRRETYIIDC